MKKVTKADLDKTLRELGYKEGDELPVPSEKTNGNEQSTNEGEGESADDGGIEVPKKPPPPQP